MTVGERIDALIEDNDTSITELAEYLKINPKQITRWKRNEQEMGINKLRAICLYYKVSADYILGLPHDLTWPRFE
ncbi:MAG: helix-turn-helix transcriptional regulator [Oscillospiraceae bacterium]|nr:helix-turn-helix transcriptional regulator [Oscillospiraceae bacterium]